MSAMGKYVFIFHFSDSDSMLYEEDDDGALSRNAMKKQSQQIVEMRTKKRTPGDKTKKGR